ncbi:MAG: glycoside hydrolase family 3 C-terminal domain-containing protein [Clostridia bacterium]|nr:glycoside hydrolase family 3 C-terminal domain-containing protein [Clostridia bacterium]
MYKKFANRAKEIISEMTLKEKIGQLNQITVTPYMNDVEKLRNMIREGQVGSIILASTATAGNDQQGRIDIDMYNELQKIAVEESRMGIPMLYGRDVIHGHRVVYPLPLASASAFNDELVEKCYRNIAEEAAADGVRWTFSPMLDLCHDPRWGRIVEGPGEDPYVGAQMARACIRGFQGDNLTDKKSIVACAKHYLGYGFSEGGRDYFRTEISDITLQNYVLPAFRAAVDEGVATVMSSFNDINGIPVSGSKKYLTDILRSQLRFNGFVVSDWGAVQMLIHHGYAEDRKDCAKKAIEAGLDLDMCVRCYIENLEMLVNDGEVSIENIDTAVERILCVKLAMGLFDRPYGEKFDYDKEKHLKDARELAAESMVLLKNNGVLPLNKEANIALMGPFTHERRSLLGTWTLDGSESETPNFYEALKNALTNGKLFCTDTSRTYDNSSEISSRADIIILALGESHWTTGERHSVSDISLSKDQIELVNKMHATDKKVVGVFFCGRPMALEGVVENLDAVLYAWHSGSETANAACDILFGDTVPSGKTPVTFPRRSTHIPLYYNTTSSGQPVNGYYGQNPQWNYTDSMASPLYPFGYGLSYTKFEYKNLSADKELISLDSLKLGGKINVSVDVSNIGEYDGKEVVQLYIRDKVASIIRPIRELKGYKKVFLKLGETQTVHFELSYKDLGFYNENGEYLVEKGVFEIYVGENCLTKNIITVKVN